METVYVKEENDTTEVNIIFIFQLTSIGSVVVVSVVSYTEVL